MKLYIIVKLKQLIKIAMFAISLTLLLVLAESNFNSVSLSTKLFFTQVFPSLFPFILFTEIILKTDIIYSISRKLEKIFYILFRVNAKAVPAIITGFLCGFPMGAKAVNDLYEKRLISKRTANNLLKFTNNCNPAFIISTVGLSMFCDIKVGIILLISHYVSAIILGIFYSYTSDYLIIHNRSTNLKLFNKKSDKLRKKIKILKDEEKTYCNINTTNNRNNEIKLNGIELLKVCISNTFKTLSMIFGFIIVFNLLFSIIDLGLYYLKVNTDFRTFLSGIMEMTSGSKNIIYSNLDKDFRICLVSFTLGFSGICIIAQILSTISKHNFSTLSIVKSKLAHGILSFIVTYILLNIKNIYYLKFTNIILLFLLLLLIILLFKVLFRKNKNSSLEI